MIVYPHAQGTWDRVRKLRPDMPSSLNQAPLGSLKCVSKGCKGAVTQVSVFASHAVWIHSSPLAVTVMYECARVRLEQGQ